MWPEQSVGTGSGLACGRKFLLARAQLLPPSFPHFSLSSHSWRELHGSLKSRFWKWTSQQVSTLTLLLLPRLKTSFCLTVTREVSTTRGPPGHHSISAPAFGPRHNFPFIHAETYLRNLLSLSLLITYYTLTVEIKIQFLSAGFWLNFSALIHSLSLLWHAGIIHSTEVGF